MRIKMYILFMIVVVAICSVYVQAEDKGEKATITIKIVKLGECKVSAKISGKVPKSARCGEAILKEIVLEGEGPNKGKKVKKVVISKNTKGLWLGVTAIIDGSEKDLPAHVVTGKFKEQQSVFLDLNGNLKASIDWVACLWTTKWSSEACAFNSSDGKMCKYCKKNGYHMEGSVVSERK